LINLRRRLCCRRIWIAARIRMGTSRHVLVMNSSVAICADKNVAYASCFCIAGIFAIFLESMAKKSNALLQQSHKQL